MILTILVSGLTTFFIGSVFHKEINKHPFIVGNFKIHHSFVGILLVILGLFIDRNFGIISAIGMGMYISHVFEEIIVNRTKISKAVFIFITKI